MSTEISVDELAQVIRQADGQHSLGAGALAEAILAKLPHLAARQPVGRDALADALVPVSDEWYRLCERRFAVNRISISGQLAEAIVEAVCAASQPVPEQHPDDIAVGAFAATMKVKMAEARAKGRGGWEDPAQCTADDLSRMLRDHVEKGDPRDVANFCMMLHQRGESIAARQPVGEPGVSNG